MIIYEIRRRKIERQYGRQQRCLSLGRAKESLVTHDDDLTFQAKVSVFIGAWTLTHSFLTTLCGYVCIFHAVKLWIRRSELSETLNNAIFDDHKHHWRNRFYKKVKENGDGSKQWPRNAVKSVDYSTAMDALNKRALILFIPFPMCSTKWLFCTMTFHCERDKGSFFTSKNTKPT